MNGSEAIVTENIALGYINYTLVWVAGNGKLMIVKNMREYDPMFVSLSGQLPDCDDHVMLISVVNGENTVILEGGFDYVERNTKGYNSHISLDNKRCIIINNNFCKFEKSAFISIIQTDSLFVEEFKFEFDGLKYYITDFQWLSNDEILIKRENPVNANPLTPLKFKFNGTKWVLATAQPAKKPAPAVKKKTNK